MRNRVCDHPAESVASGGKSVADVAVQAAIAALGSVGSLLDGLSADQLAQVLDGAAVLPIAAGGIVFPPFDGRPHVGILLSGVARAYLSSADGRQFTIRYARQGSLLGTRSLVSGDHAPIRVQALSTCRVLEINRNALLRLAHQDVQVAGLLIDELSERVRDLYFTVADSAFGSLRQQIARHLLLLGEESSNGERHANVTQQQLAYAVGTTREVVARTLRLMRNEGIVRTEKGRIVVLDAERLTGLLGSWRSAAI
jgi:CRP/FNR family cyclic AMP-dependent transcriptional regulator